ncbi:MAG: FtsX-like permease family protein [Syntrophaceae bacterium]|nr:FtsX-like permease family protein [Syntrophaceae bacterium]
MRLSTVTRSFLRYLYRRRSLSLLQLLGIACGVAAVIGMTLSAQSALSSFSQAVEFLRGKSSHTLERLAGPMDESILRDLAADPAVVSFAPVVERRLKLENGDLVRILGIDPFLDRAIRPELSRAPFERDPGASFEDSLAFLTDERAVLVEAELARGLGLQKGGELPTLKGTLRVIGTFANPSGEPLILMDIAHAQKLLGLAGKVDHVDLILGDESGFASRWQEGWRIQSKRQRQDTFGAMVGAFRLNLEALSLMALFVSVFLIYNTAMFAVVSRRRDAGVLRSLGASRGEVALAFLTEIALFGILGGLLGGLLGYLLSRALTDVIGGTISTLYFFLRPAPVPWSWWVPAAGAAVGLGASLLGSLYPLLELTRTDPVRTLRGRSGGRGNRRRAWIAALAGGAVLVVSIVLLAFFSKRIYVAFAGVFGFLFGLSLLTGVVMVLADPLLARLLGSLGRLPGRIAAGNIIRNLGRTGVAVAAFMVALSLSIGLGSMIGSFRESLIWWMGTQLRGDLYVSNASDMEVPEAFYEEIRDIPGVGGVDTYRKVQVPYRGRTVHVVGIKADVLQRFARFGWVEGGDEHWEAVKRGDVIVSESFARSFGARPGSVVTLESLTGPVGLRIEGVFYDYSTEHGLIMMDRATYIGLYGDRTINSIAVFLDPAEPRRKQILDDIRARAIARGLPALTREQFHRNILEIFDSTFAVTRSMRILAIVIAFFGITGALMTLFIERQRDLGILRALGFSTGQVARMTLLEALGMGLVSFALSAGVGTVLALLLIRVINLRSFNWTVFYYPDWQPYALTALTALAASVGAALYPIWKVHRTYPQMQIREE